MLLVKQAAGARIKAQQQLASGETNGPQGPIGMLVAGHLPNPQRRPATVSMRSVARMGN